MKNFRARYAPAWTAYIDDANWWPGSRARGGPNLIPNRRFWKSATHRARGPSRPIIASSAITTAVKRSQQQPARCRHRWRNHQGSAIGDHLPGTGHRRDYTLSYWHRQGTVPAPLTVRFSGNGSCDLHSDPCGDGVLGRIFVDGAVIRERSSSAAWIIR